MKLKIEMDNAAFEDNGGGTLRRAIKHDEQTKRDVIDACNFGAEVKRLRAALTDCLDTFDGPTEYLNGCSTRDMSAKIRRALGENKLSTSGE